MKQLLAIENQSERVRKEKQRERTKRERARMIARLKSKAQEQGSSQAQGKPNQAARKYMFLGSIRQLTPGTFVLQIPFFCCNMALCFCLSFVNLHCRAAVFGGSCVMGRQRLVGSLKM